MKKYILFMIIILFYQTLFCEEANSKLVSHIDLFSVSWHYRPHILYSIQDANGTLNSLKWSKTSSKYIVKNEKIENFENSKCDTGAFTFYNMISDSLFCAGISGYLNDYEFKDIDISEYECRTLCLVIYNDNTVQYVSFYKNEMIISFAKWCSEVATGLMSIRRPVPFRLHMPYCIVNVYEEML